MPVDLKIARPLQFNSSDGRTYEFGIGLYTAMDDNFAADPWVVSHLENAILQRGSLLFQWRILQTGLPAMIFLYPPVNGHLFTNTIEAGWPPIFIDDLDVDLERPGPDVPAPYGGAERFFRYGSLGHSSSRMREFANAELYNTIKVYPGDGVSPPVSRTIQSPPILLDDAGFPVSVANVEHMRRTVQMRLMRERENFHAAALEQLARGRAPHLPRRAATVAPPAPTPPPPPPPFDWSGHVYREEPYTWRQPTPNVAAPVPSAGLHWHNVQPPR